MLFEWDDKKEQINIAKHGIDFSTAALVFDDPNRIEKYDNLHSDWEDRYITIGLVNGTAVLVMVVYTERNPSIRIISARLATKREKEAYYRAQGIDISKKATPEQLKMLADAAKLPFPKDAEYPEFSEEDLKQFKKSQKSVDREAKTNGDVTSLAASIEKGQIPGKRLHLHFKSDS